MKKIRIIALSLLLVFSANFLVSCYGKFALVGRIYEWNGQVGEKLLNTLVFWGLCIIPVYEAAAFIDFWILNVIEFWSGSNPLAMKEGDKEIKVVKKDGKEFEIKVTKNRYDIREIKGNSFGKTVSMVFHPSEKAWYAENAQQSIKLAQVVTIGSTADVKLFLPNNKSFSVGAYDVKSVSDARTVYSMKLEAVAAK